MEFVRSDIACSGILLRFLSALIWTDLRLFLALVTFYTLIFLQIFPRQNVSYLDLDMPFLLREQETIKKEQKKATIAERPESQ